MSSLLTPKRRDKAKKKSRAAHSMSPGIRTSSSPSVASASSKNNHGKRYQAISDDEEGSPPRNHILAGSRLYHQAMNSTSNNSMPPRTVTPTGSIASNQRNQFNHPQFQQQPSWEDLSEGAYASKSRSSAAGKLHGRAPSPFLSHGTPQVRVVSRTPSYSSYFRRSMDEQDEEPFDEDMPMDERMDRKHEQRQIRSLQTPRSTDADSSAASATYRSMTPTREVTEIVMSSSHESIRDDNGIARMIDALNRGSNTRPENLSRDERILWDALQTSMVNDRNEHLAKRRTLERSLQESNSKLGQLSTRETELELELTKSKCECADLEHKYTMALAENRVLVGKVGGKATEIRDTSNAQDAAVDKEVQHLSSVEEKLRDKEDELAQQRKDHDAEVRAIQRVLADLTTEKIKAEERVEELEKQLSVAPESSSNVEKMEAEKESQSVEVDKSSPEYEVIEQELAAAKRHSNSLADEKQKLQSELDAARSESEKLTMEISGLKTQVSGLESDIVSEKGQNDHLRAQVTDLAKIRNEAMSQDRTMDPPKPEVDHPKPESHGQDEEGEKEPPTSTTAESKHKELDSLQQELRETMSSLENAKKIIASLEHANGSLAIDQRAKLKSKEEELLATQKESDERKRRLDSLAMELRDLQRRQGDVEEIEKRIRNQLVKQKALVGHLHTSISDLQSAIAVHEASTSSETGATDRTSIEEISEILSDALNAMNDTLASTEEVLEDADADDVSDVELSSEVGRHIDAIIRNDREAAAKQLRSQLDQKRIAVKRLEEALKKQNEEMKKLRAQLIGSNRGQGESDEQLRAEIVSLRQQCSTNMEVLAKKERELSVLRSSLKVDDNDAGYISDDASDDDEDEEVGNKKLSSPPSLDTYGPAEAEALATILSQTAGGIEISGRTHEIQALREQLLRALGDSESANKELKAERESLANAKMIISSLEQANKGMMEDLRSRLQDSNTAIASLLDKSMEHEKNAEKYQQELEEMKKERLEEQEKLKQLQEELSRRVGDCKVGESTDESKVDPATPTEEKKEEVLTAVI